MTRLMGQRVRAAGLSLVFTRFNIRRGLVVSSGLSFGAEAVMDVITTTP